MLPRRFLFNLLFILALSSTCPVQASEHDLYVCAAVNKNYVIGSKIVTTSGIHLHKGRGEWQHVGINDPSISAVSFDPRNHDILYTAALNGALRTLDGGKSWRILTSWNITEPKDVCIDPFAPDTIYLAHPGGIAVSRDQGMHWEPMEKGLPDRGKYTQTIETDRSRKGRILAGCETGVYLTENGGRSWRKVLPTAETVTDIQQSPHNPETWAAVTQSAGAWASIDGGKTWKQFPDVPTGASLYNIAFDATNPKRLAIGSYTVGVLTSEDRGATWTDRNAGLPDPHQVWRVGIHPDTGRLYASVYQNALYQSDDFGRSWEKEGLEGSAVNSFVFLPKGGSSDGK
ncbi:MAG: hypothetical protein KJT03_03555 [Verrucomicrobiae bacterium]|nr:hypothetical protein [Verrucomicrobiae bacterium]